MLLTRFLALTLVFQIGFGYSLVVLADHSGVPPKDTYSEPVPENTPQIKDLQPFDRHLLVEQYRRFKNKEGQTVEKRLGKTDVALPAVEIANPEKELSIVYNPALRELEIRKADSSDSHVIKNLDLTTPKILVDGNFILFSTQEGIRGIYWPQLMKLGFSAAVPINLLVIAPPQGQVTDLEFLTPASQPKTYTETPKMIFAGDLSLTVTDKEGKTAHHHISRKELTIQLASEQEELLQLLVVVNPDLDSMDIIGSLYKNVPANEGQIFKTREGLLESGQSSDMVRHSLAGIAQKMDLKEMFSLLKKDESGSSPLSSLGAQPRHGFSADPREDGEWAQLARTIEAEKKKDSKKTWEQILIAQYQNEYRNIPQISKALEKQKDMVERRTTTILEKVKAVATPKRIGLLAAALGVDWINHTSDDFLVRGAVSFMTRYLSWVHSVPGISSLISPLSKLPEYLMDDWSMSRLYVATVGFLMFRPLSMWVAGTVAKMRGENWDNVQAFFSYGLKVYGAISYPIQKLFWDMTGRKNLYTALENGVNPLKSKSAWQKNPEKLNDVIDQETLKKSRALLLAALIVSEKSSGQAVPIDPATLILLMNAPAEDQLQLLAKASQSGVHHVIWQDLVSSLMNEMKNVSSGEFQAVDKQSVQEYYKILNTVSQSLQTSNKSSVNIWVKENWRSFKRMTSKNVIPYVLWGLGQYDLYKKLKAIKTVDSETAHIAEHQYRDDYDFSTVFYAGVDAATFGSVPLMQIKSIAEVTSNQLEQVFIYGVQLGYDALSTGKSGGLYNPYPALTDEAFAPARDKSLSFGEAAKAIGENIMDPKSDSMFSKFHGQFQLNTLLGFQVRMAAGVFVRATAITVIALAAGSDLVEGLISAGRAIPLQATALIGKIAIFSTGIGYATVWPYVTYAMRSMAGKVKGNDNRLKMAHYQLDLGIRVQDSARIDSAVSELKALYEASGQSVPASIFKYEKNMSSNQVTEAFATASSVLKESLAQPPIATKGNERMAWTLNTVFGAAVSTILYVSLSKTLFNPAANSIDLFTNSAFWFAATFAGNTALGKITPYITSKIKAVFSKKECEATLLKDK